MKKLIKLGLLMIMVSILLMQKETVITFIKDVLDPKNINVELKEKNEYYRNYDFSFVQNTDNFNPECQQDILNIYYTAINAGKNSFTFYCSKDYTTCLDDIKELANNQETLSHINNFVHPYNGFQHIETEYDNLGKVTINIYKSYTDSDIEAIEKVLDNIENNVLNKNLSLTENIKLAHDYIINNSTYDIDKKNTGVTNYKSDIAYGPLIEGYGICGGYTDAMELILERLGVESYKISSSNHVWNALKLDNTWYHLDLTWDDPITSNNTPILDHSFFLINTNKLLEIETTEHQFNQDIYSELKLKYN